MKLLNLKLLWISFIAVLTQLIECQIRNLEAVGLNPADGSLAPDVVEQARQSLKNIGEILKASGCDYSNVVKTSVFITDLSAFAAVNKVYATFFSKPYPARSCVEVSKLPKGGLVEIECIAKKSVFMLNIAYK